MTSPARPTRPALVLVDAVAVLAFAAIGRASHAEDVTGTLATAAPFLVGAVVGGLVAHAWRAPLRWRTGVFTWLGAAGVGLALRFAAERSLPWSFAIVATVSLGVLILGWRGVAHLVVRTRGGRRTRSRA